MLDKAKINLSRQITSIRKDYSCQFSQNILKTPYLCRHERVQTNRLDAHH